MRGRWFAVVLALAGCQKVEAFVCAADSECASGSKAGTCEQSGFCSFPDDGCASGKRYGDWAGEGMAGSCVEAVACAPACGPCEQCVDGACELEVGCEVPCEPACGACKLCVGGECMPAAGLQCEVECSEFVYGLADGNSPPSCLAYASGTGTGTCDGGGTCVPAEGGCTDPGAEIVGCDLACRRDDHNCDPNTPAAAVTAATLCTTGAETAECASVCTDAMGKASTLLPQKCDASGRCTAEMMTDCGLYACAGPSACATMCAKSTDCAPMAMCDMMTSTCM